MVFALVRRGAHEAVAVAFDDVEPGFAGMAVQRLGLTWRELDHDLCDARGLAADGAVDEELGARAARRGQQILLVVGRVDAPGAALARFNGEAAQAPCIGIVALRALAERRARRQRSHVVVAAVLDHAQAERPEHRLGRVAHEARGLLAVVAAAMPGPRGDVDRVPGLPAVAHAVDLGPARAFDDEELRVPGVPVNGGHHAGIDLVHQRVEAARRRVAVPAHVDAGAHAARRALQHHIIPADYAAAVFAPLLQELGAALFLDVVVRDRSGSLGRHFLYAEPCSRESARTIE